MSRVLNDRPGVAQATRDSVLVAVDRLGYERPSRLRRKSAGLIGVIAPELTNPVFPAMAQLIEAQLAADAFTAVLCTQTQEHLYEEDYVEMLLERGVAGIIFVSGVHSSIACDPARYNDLRERGVPIVLINGYLGGVDAPFVSNDDVRAVEIAVSHLAAAGHRRIGLAVGPKRYTPVIRKVASFRSAIWATLGVEDVDGLVQHDSFTVQGGASAARELLERGVTGIVCGSDLMALGAITAARSLGLDVPRHVSVIGYDDSPLMAFTDPALTTIRQNIGGIAAAAAQALLTEINGGVAHRAEMLFGPELVVRASTAGPPTRRRRHPSHLGERP